MKIWKKILIDLTGESAVKLRKKYFQENWKKKYISIRSNFQKHLGVYLDTKLNLTHHVKEKLKKL